MHEHADPDALPDPATISDDPTAADGIDLDYWFPSYGETLRELLAEVLTEE